MAMSLYERLGAAEGITEIVDDVIAAHLANPIVKTRFENIDDIERTKKMATDFFCAGSGGPQAYTGKDMREAHQGMNINEQEYLAVIDASCRRWKSIGSMTPQRKTCLQFLYSLKGEIIRV